MRVLVTGAAGFIGSNLTARCLSEGWDVVGVDDMSNGHEEFLPSGFISNDKKFLRGDFASDVVLGLIKQKSFDVVFHLAAVPRVSYSVEYPVETHETNVNKTLQLMDACKGNVKRFVFASSSAVYGAADTLPTSEDCPKDPKSPYALQKSIIEDYLKMYEMLYGLDSVCLRFFNVFGPNQLGDSPYSTAVSAWLTAIKKGRSMRSDGDGSQSRDMCYVDNVVDACIRSAKHDGKLGAVCLNVACGERTTNKEILDFLKTRYPYAQSHDAPWRPGDVMHTLANIKKIHDVLQYEPVVGFWEGLDRTIDWYEKNWDTFSKVGT